MPGWGGRSEKCQEATWAGPFGRIVARPVEPFYDPGRGGAGIPLVREQRRLAAIVAADVVASGAPRWD